LEAVAIRQMPRFRLLTLGATVAVLPVLWLLPVVAPNSVGAAVIRHVIALVCVIFALVCGWVAYRHLIGRDRTTWLFIIVALAWLVVAGVANLVGFALTGDFLRSPSVEDVANLLALGALGVAAVRIGEPTRAWMPVRLGRAVNFMVLVIVAYATITVLMMRPLAMIPASGFTARALVFSVYATIPLAIAVYPIVFRSDPWSEWTVLFVASLLSGAVFTLAFAWQIGSGVFDNYGVLTGELHSLFSLSSLLVAMSAAWRATETTGPAPEPLPDRIEVRWQELALMGVAAVAVPLVFREAVTRPAPTTTLIVGAAALALILLLIARSALSVFESTAAVGKVDTAERYRALVDNAPVAVLVLGLDGRILFANQSAATVLRAATAFDLLGLDVDKLLPDELPAEFEDLQALAGALSATPDSRPDAIPLRESRLRALDGEMVIAERTAAAIKFSGKPAILIQGVDVTARAKAEEEIARYREQLRGYADEIVRAEEDERRRLASALHDNVSQPLAVARMRMQAAHAAGHFVGTDAAIAQTMIEHAIAETRLLTTELAPQLLYELGLRAAVTALATQLGEVHAVSFQCDGDVDDSVLTDEVRGALYRATRELLMNVIKHAMVSEARVEFRQNDRQFSISVVDNGAGYDPDAVATRRVESFGLFSIRERLAKLGGSLEVRSAPGQGTAATLSVPLR